MAGMDLIGLSTAPGLALVLLVPIGGVCVATCLAWMCYVVLEALDPPMPLKEATPRVPRTRIERQQADISLSGEYIRLALRQLDRANDDLAGSRGLCVALATTDLAALVAIAIGTATLKAGSIALGLWWLPVPVFALSSIVAAIGALPLASLKADAGPLSEDVPTKIAGPIAAAAGADAGRYWLSVNLQLLSELQDSRKRSGNRERSVTTMFVIAAAIATAGFLVGLLVLISQVSSAST